jgi:hypothetical protein
MRSSAPDMHDDAVRALVEALSASAVDAVASSGARGPDIWMDGPLGRVAVEVKAVSAADPIRIAGLLDAVAMVGESTYVLVADEIPDASRELLRSRGWSYLDRRGRLWFTAAGTRINDTELSPMPRTGIADRPAEPIGGRVGVAIALQLLMHPEGSLSVRELARQVGCSASSAHAAHSRLRDAALVEPDGRPLVPSLFWAVADVWRPVRQPVGRAPGPGDIDLEDGSGSWVVSGDVAAAAWGAPVAVGSGSPPDLYAPTQRAARQAVRRLGDVSWTDRHATIASISVTAVTRDFDPQHQSLATPWLHWPLAHPVVVALDLAQDKSRGREILDGWIPPTGYARVW